MPDEDPPRLRCFLALRYGPEFQLVKRAVEKGVRDAGFQPISTDDRSPRLIPVQNTIAGDLARADCVIADITGLSPNVFFEIGLAQAMGKPLFLLSRGLTENIPFDLRSFEFISYDASLNRMNDLTKRIGQLLRRYRRSPRRAGVLAGAPFPTPFFVEWDRLERVDAENLCRELLTQMGYQRVDWVKKPGEFDLIAELPKKDPDGFEYRELWLVAMGRNAPPEIVAEMVVMDPDYLLHRLQRFDKRLERLVTRAPAEIPLTILIILLEGDRSIEELDRLRQRVERPIRRSRYPGAVRMRVWDRHYLTSLIQQFPQIGYKYFSDEGRSRSKFRKAPEELYTENVALTTRLGASIAALEEEKNKRVRAERDAIWKDISFAAAHKIGNPLFAIETNLDPLERRINEQRAEEAAEVTRSIRASVEKAKGIVDQFKSLTRAQEIHPVPTLLRPILEDACGVAKAQDFDCKIDCEPNVSIQGDPERLAECFDELAFNSTHWFDKPTKLIEVNATQPTREHLPPYVDSSQKYVLIHFKDNGCGVAIDKKDKIFDAFFTTRDHGTGLGLALVRRIIEGHGGTILESGVPGKGADFEIYLPAGKKRPAAVRAKKQPAETKKQLSTKKVALTKKKSSGRKRGQKG